MGQALDGQGRAFASLNLGLVDVLLLPANFQSRLGIQ